MLHLRVGHFTCTHPEHMSHLLLTPRLVTLCAHGYFLAGPGFACISPDICRSISWVWSGCRCCSFVIMVQISSAALNRVDLDLLASFVDKQFHLVWADIFGTTLTLPIHKHLQLHALQFHQKTQHLSHPLHKHTLKTQG